jgi:hypothetical protein
MSAECTELSAGDEETDNEDDKDYNGNIEQQIPSEILFP